MAEFSWGHSSTNTREITLVHNYVKTSHVSRQNIHFLFFFCILIFFFFAFRCYFCYFHFYFCRKYIDIFEFHCLFKKKNCQKNIVIFAFQATLSRLQGAIGQLPMIWLPLVHSTPRYECGVFRTGCVWESSPSLLDTLYTLVCSIPPTTTCFSYPLCNLWIHITGIEVWLSNVRHFWNAGSWRRLRRRMVSINNINKTIVLTWKPDFKSES